MSGTRLTIELARMTAYFQLRTIATHMGANPNAVDPERITVKITPRATKRGAEATTRAEQASRSQFPGRAAPHSEGTPA